MDLTFFNTLKIRLKENEDGHKFHEIFLPKNRDFFSVTDQKAKNYRKSAVLILLYHKEERLKSILIERSSYHGAHSGQISFPGGKYEEEDMHLVNTAIRETYEEIGVITSPMDVLGALSPVAIPISQFAVYPFICLIPFVPAIQKEPNEVIDAIEFDVMDFIKHATIEERKVQAIDRELIVPCFLINGHIVWGATGMILNEFRELALSSLK